MTINIILGLGGTISLLGIIGLLLRKNLVIMLMSLELTLLGAVVGLIGGAPLHENAAHVPVGALFIPFIFVIAAAEACVGLTLILILLKKQNTLWVDEIDET